ncbi:PREDICTED: lipase maturation factor 1 [Dipodomys ordii]|uniref:Lipase maturation factor n=1 Tax=Dipodomys ordii TaxID=10020 RepID=A0A1S3EQQ9_DIPOR|nr:PREDICTED: lipase maturation factor 1 [Dipodomys ordii]
MNVATVNGRPEQCLCAHSSTLSPLPSGGLQMSLYTKHPQPPLPAPASCLLALPTAASDPEASGLTPPGPQDLQALGTPTPRETQQDVDSVCAAHCNICVAFLVAFQQNKALIGDRGLLPCRLYLRSVQQYFQGQASWDAWSYAPTLFWLLDWADMNFNLDLFALLGLGISAFILVTGCANMILMAVLWVLYLSLVNVGQVWYSFGWESQLLETGFLGIFLCPLWTLSRLPKSTPPSRIVLWGFRWLIFRIMLGAGLIKVRGDRCWWDLTCMDFHYETQPVPNPLAYYLHRSPWWLHRFETLGNHVVELLVPFLVFLGRRPCLLHGVLQILFQVGHGWVATLVARAPGCPLSCRWVRGEHYRYQFSRPGGRHAAQGKWWLRRRIGPYFPPLRLEDLRDYFEAREWPLPQPI